MTVLTPVLYQSLAERASFPRLGERLVEQVRDGETGRSPRELTFMVGEYRLEPFLRPISLNSAAQGAIGTLLLSGKELDVLLTDANADRRRRWRRRRRGGNADRLGASWWEFWRTESDGWALFPANHSPGLQVDVMLPLPTAHGFQLRTLAVGPAVTPEGELTVDPPRVVAADGCVHEAEQDEPGAPYRGRCRNEHCLYSCSARVVLMPDDGLYRLLGCSC